MDLMNLPGFEFLKVYAVLFVAAILASLLLRRLLRGPATAIPREADGLDPMEIAYLAGGPRLAINTALTSLHHAGSIRVTAGTRSLQAVHPPPDGASTMEKGIYTYIATDSSRSVGEVHKNFPVEIPARRPLALGLILSAGQRASLALMSIMPLLVVALLGVAKVFVGVSRGKPVGFLIALLVITAIVTVIFASKTPRRTPAGDNVLRALSSTHAALRSTAETRMGALSPAELALAVGLFGPALLAYADETDQLRKAMMPSNTSSGSSCGSGCGSGGGSSCGGGSGCGGGGCGGCGGGGD